MKKVKEKILDNDYFVFFCIVVLPIIVGIVIMLIN